MGEFHVSCKRFGLIEASAPFGDGGLSGTNPKAAIKNSPTAPTARIVCFHRSGIAGNDAGPSPDRRKRSRSTSYSKIWGKGIGITGCLCSAQYSDAVACSREVNANIAYVRIAPPKGDCVTINGDHFALDRLFTSIEIRRNSHAHSWFETLWVKWIGGLLRDRLTFRSAHDGVLR